MKRGKNSKVYYSSNISWTLQKGSWLIHFIMTALFYVLYSQFISNNLSYQLTILTYNISTFIFFHWIVGDPFDKNFREFTFWEQLQEQMENSNTLIFMALYPVILFMIINKLVIWDGTLYVMSWISLLMVVIPKLSFMHMKRIFKRYD